MPHDKQKAFHYIKEAKREMAKNNQNNTNQSQTVQRQLNQLEESPNRRNKKGSTNQIQPEATGEGWTQ